MKLNRHAKFIGHMLVLFVLMMAVSIGIEMRYYAQLIIWGLFAYIIAKDVIDYIRCERRREQCEKDQAGITRIMGKLDRMKQDIEGTV